MPGGGETDPRCPANSKGHGELLLPSVSHCVGVLRDGEAEHHPALGVLGNMAVGHPASGIGDFQQDVHRLPCAPEHGVLPHEVGLRLTVPSEDQEAACSMDVERVMHRMI